MCVCVCVCVCVCGGQRSRLKTEAAGGIIKFSEYY